MLSKLVPTQLLPHWVKEDRIEDVWSSIGTVRARGYQKLRKKKKNFLQTDYYVPLKQLTSCDL